jgi:hypothetical protein
MVLQCTIEVGAEDYYSCDLTRKIPVRVRLVTINGDTGFGITESSKGDEEAIQDYIKGLEASPSIKEVNILHRSQEAYWTRVVHQLGRSSIHETILDSGCMTRLKSQPTASFGVALTEKQQEAFLLAFQSGYYEMPRKSRIDQMCKKLGIKRVAMQERLRRAELRIISDFAESLP